MINHQDICNFKFQRVYLISFLLDKFTLANSANTRYSILLAFSSSFALFFSFHFFLRPLRSTQSIKQDYKSTRKDNKASVLHFAAGSARTRQTNRYSFTRLGSNRRKNGGEQLLGGKKSRQGEAELDGRITGKLRLKIELKPRRSASQTRW